MRRLFWMGVGAVGAVVVAQRVRQTARKLTPEGVVEQAVDAGRRAGSALRDAVAEFRDACAEREVELVTALLVEPEGGTAAERRAARDTRAAGETRATRPPAAARSAAPARPDAFDRRTPVDEDEDDFF